MIKSLYKVLHNNPHAYLTDNDLKIMLSGSPDSRYGKVKRLIANGVLLHVRRGLYCLQDMIDNPSKFHPYELAQYIYGPSYISLESALSYHGLIPEAVYTVTSVTGKRPKEFRTPLGFFSYLHVPLESLFIGVELIKKNEQQFFMAKPWKAICDYIFCYKKDWNNLKPLLESLRINREDLPILLDEEIQLLNEYYHHNRIARFLKGIRKDLK